MGDRIQNVQPKVYNGITYRSTLEAETAKVLDSLHLPFRYEEVKYDLLEGFRCPYQKDKVRSITYTPDFIVGDNIIIECKGFETPEWKLKKKMVFKYLMDNHPEMYFYQTHDYRKSLLEVLDNHWGSLGYYIEVTSKKKIKVNTKKNTTETSNYINSYSSIKQAMEDLGLKKNIGPILKSLSGMQEYVYSFNWKLKELPL